MLRYAARERRVNKKNKLKPVDMQGPTDSSDDRNCAIVLGGRVNGIGVIRSLGRIGVHCGAVFPDVRGDHAHHSRYLKAYARTSHAPDDTEIVDALQHVLDQLESRGISTRARVVLVPTTDRFSQFMAENRDSLSERFIVNCAPIDLYDAFLDKWKTATICSENGVLIPTTVCPHSDAELKEVAAAIRYPVIIKPRYTFGGRFPGKNAQASDVSELLEFFERYDVLGDAVIQEIVPSGDGDILVIATYSDADGHVHAVYSGRKIRQYPPDFGVTCFGTSDPFPEVRENCRQFLEAIGYKGFAMIEYARSRTDGKAYFLELNTRASWTNQLFADAGIDLSRIGYMDMVGRSYVDEFGPVEQKDGVVFLDFRRDLASMRIKRSEGKIGVLQWLKTLPRARSFAYLSVGDPIPFLAAVGWRFGQLALSFLPGSSR